MRFILNGVPHFFVQYCIWCLGRLAVRNVSKWNSVHILPAACHEDMSEHIGNEKHSFVGGVDISCILWCRRMVNKKVPLSSDSGTFGVILPYGCLVTLSLPCVPHRCSV